MIIHHPLSSTNKTHKYFVSKRHLELATEGVKCEDLSPAQRIHQHCLALISSHLKQGNSQNGARLEYAVYDACVEHIPESKIYFSRPETLAITRVPGDAVDADIIVLKYGIFWCLHCKASLRERWGLAALAALMIRFGPYIQWLLKGGQVTTRVEDAPLMRTSKHVLVTWREYKTKKSHSRTVPWTADDQLRYAKNLEQKIEECGLPNLIYKVVSPFNTEEFDSLFREINKEPDAVKFSERNGNVA